MVKEEESAEPKAKSAAVIEGMPEGVILVNMDGEVTYINKAFEELLGYKANELVGKSVAELLTYRKSEDIEKAMEFMKEVIKKGSVSPIEMDAITKDGKEISISFTASVIKDTQGNPISMVAIARDITELKRAEEERVQTQQKYMSLVNNLKVGIYRRRPDGRFVEVNPALVSILEANSKEDVMLNHHANDTHLDPQKYEEINKKILKFGYIKDEEVELVTYKGNKLWASVTVAANKDKGGNIYFDGALYDITERKRAEEKLKESEEHTRIFAAYQHAVSELREFYIVDASFEQMVQKTLDLIIEKFGYYMAWYAELIEKEKVILPKLWAGKHEKYLDGLRLEFESDKRDAKCAMSIAILTKKPFGYADLEHDKDFEKWRAFALRYGYRSNQAMPLIVDGECKSAFLIYSTRPFAFSEKLVEYLKSIINELATIIENITALKRLQEKEKELAAAAAVADIEKKRAAELEAAYKELSEKSERLERFHKVTVSRELDMVKLKEEINSLLEKLGQPKKYDEPDKIKEARGRRQKSDDQRTNDKEI